MSESDFKRKSRELLIDLASQCSSIVSEKTGMSKELADQIGQEVAIRMSLHWGGQNLYFPMGQAFGSSQRDRQIYNDYKNSSNVDIPSIAKKHGVSSQWVYKVIKELRSEEIAQRQISMFPDSDKKS